MNEDNDPTAVNDVLKSAERYALWRQRYDEAALGSREIDRAQEECITLAAEVRRLHELLACGDFKDVYAEGLCLGQKLGASLAQARIAELETSQRDHFRERERLHALITLRGKELLAIEAKLATTESLPAKWRDTADGQEWTEEDGLVRDVFCECLRECADDLEKALRS